MGLKSGLTERVISVAPRRMRADGRRNRDRLIEAAKLTFTSLGPNVSLEAVARHAGVGIGTLYRHFPSRDALIEAICRNEVEQLAGAVPHLLENHAPAEALRQWMRLYVDFIATNKLMASAVSAIFGISAGQYRSSVAQITDNPVLGSTSEVYRRATELYLEAAATLLERARSVGEVRADIHAHDLMRALGGFTVTYGEDVEGWEASALRLVDVLMDGLRTHADR